MNAARVENIRCPKCGEVHFMGRDENNMDKHPEPCACGHKFGLGDILTQMAAQAPPLITLRWSEELDRLAWLLEMAGMEVQVVKGNFTRQVWFRSRKKDEWIIARRADNHDTH